MPQMSAEAQQAASGTVTVGAWTFVASATSQASNTLILNVDGGFAVSSTDVILYPVTTNSANELWLRTVENYIVSMLDSNLCLTA